MQWFHNLTFRARILTLTIILTLGIIWIGAMGYWGIDQLEDGIANTGDTRIPTLIALSTLNGERMAIRAQTQSVFQYETQSDAQQHFRAILDERQESWRTIDEQWQVLEETPRQSEAGRQAWSELQRQYRDWREIYVELDAVIVEMATSRNSSQQAALFERYREVVDRMVPISDRMGATMQSMVGNNMAVTRSQIDEAMSLGISLERGIAVAVLWTVLISSLIAWFIIRSSNKLLVAAIRAISEGNTQVVSASDQIASAASSLAEGASQQANSVEEVTATSEEATSLNNQNAEHIREADQLAAKATTAASHGYDKIQQLMTSMEEVSASSERISHIIKTIDDIAFQTNLLALNAAVEAARAGEHGLGFAVVAEEVKGLAQRSANAARETADIIESTISQIKEGNQVASETNDAFDEIRQQIKKTSQLIGEITVSVKEQSDGMNQISSAMSQIDKVTQQNAANSEQAAAAAQQLNAQAINMLQSVASVARFAGYSMENQGGHSRSKGQLARSTSETRMLAPAREAHSNSRQLRKGAQDKQNNRNQAFRLEDDDLREF
ncbi:methyl-accepting chemotaxis protein [Desulfurispira natronophila]|uniref:Methyl-accepting chemotaxis protein n=1 Tax=Desulfurispira natronophila TaxID=682562 RepID=A0A7W8DGA7_9BACT|nr:methyl-accepting chemotaxis protein [Desulfurispira natronophila]MBB5021164.1 methyl-accepting chemotaxis protein [Desulfurispira natronophila]